MVKTPKSARDNLRFLIAEVASQLSLLRTFFAAPSPLIAQHITERSGYVINLKMRIHTSCYAALSQAVAGENETLPLHALTSIASDLERIAELCRDVAQQVNGRPLLNASHYADFELMLNRVIRETGRIEPAFWQRNSRLALKIGRAEKVLERSHNKLIKQYTTRLKQKKKVASLVCLLFVAYNIRQMGGVLLSISEAIISVTLGQSGGIDRYHTVQASFDYLSDNTTPSSDLVIESIAQTRSGSVISGIGRADGEEDGYVAVFKDGTESKLKEERQGVESWHEIYPGLAPQILSYHKEGQSSALLIEHLAGLTFEKIVLHESDQRLYESFQQLIATLTSVWHETRSAKCVSPHYMRQLAKRLDAVYSIHPEFGESESAIGELQLRSFDALIRQAGLYERKLKVPFSVYIHGDFNIDNIIYNPVEKRINFIDLHRSCYMDYLQDVSVFMVSNYRLQVLDSVTRQRTVQLALAFYLFAADFATQVGDDTFDRRLALGLARSFATSTRFILDKALAKSMFMRARYLLEQLLALSPQQAQIYRVPIEALFTR